MRTSSSISIALLLVACGGGGPPPAPDAAVEQRDASGARALDAGGGTCGATTSPIGWEPLPESCLPRCSRATRVATAECAGSPSCVAAALAADPTPSAWVRTPSGVYEVQCGEDGTGYACRLWQSYACQFDSCPDEYEAWVRCRAAGGACTLEQASLEECTAADPAFTSCVTGRDEACFALE